MGRWCTMIRAVPLASGLVAMHISSSNTFWIFHCGWCSLSYLTNIYTFQHNESKYKCKEDLPPKHWEDLLHDPKKKKKNYKGCNKQKLHLEANHSSPGFCWRLSCIDYFLTWDSFCFLYPCVIFQCLVNKRHLEWALVVYQIGWYSQPLVLQCLLA